MHELDDIIIKQTAEVASGEVKSSLIRNKDAKLESQLANLDDLVKEHIAELAPSETISSLIRMKDAILKNLEHAQKDLNVIELQARLRGALTRSRFEGNIQSLRNSVVFLVCWWRFRGDL